MLLIIYESCVVVETEALLIIFLSGNVDTLRNGSTVPVICIEKVLQHRRGSVNVNSPVHSPPSIQVVPSVEYLKVAFFISAGRVSLTLTSSAASGPLLFTFIVYVIVSPGVTEVLSYTL